MPVNGQYISKGYPPIWYQQEQQQQKQFIYQKLIVNITTIKGYSYSYIATIITIISFTINNKTPTKTLNWSINIFEVFFIHKTLANTLIYSTGITESECNWAETFWQTSTAYKRTKNNTFIQKKQTTTLHYKWPKALRLLYVEDYNDTIILLSSCLQTNKDPP